LEGKKTTFKNKASGDLFLLAIVYNKFQQFPLKSIETAMAIHVVYITAMAIHVVYITAMAIHEEYIII
jgi:hypothetical protein